VYKRQQPDRLTAMYREGREQEQEH